MMGTRRCHILLSKELAVTTLQFGVLLLLASFAANAQTITLTTAANDGRPVDTIVRQIETLSGIPINYEDLLYSNPADTMNIATSVAPAASPSAQLIVPRGGVLSVPIIVDLVTQKLLDSLATTNALNSLLSAASSSTNCGGNF